MSSLIECPECRRHLFSSEQRCPFCASPVDVVTTRSTNARMSRAAQLAWKITLGGMTACASSPPPQRTSESAPVFDAAPPEVKDAAVEDASPFPTGVPIYGASMIKIMQRLTFDRGAEKIAKEGNDLLDAVAEAMRSNPEILVVLDGHTTPDEPAKLADARAGRVAAELVKRGVPKERLHVRGNGSSRPIEPGVPATNRRVEFNVTDKSEFSDAGKPLK